jgi:hypothetical protein
VDLSPDDLIAAMKDPTKLLPAPEDKSEETEK